jgi:hypothetical protein
MHQRGRRISRSLRPRPHSEELYSQSTKPLPSQTAGHVPAEAHAGIRIGFLFSDRRKYIVALFSKSVFFKSLLSVFTVFSIRAD